MPTGPFFCRKTLSSNITSRSEEYEEKLKQLVHILLAISVFVPSECSFGTIFFHSSSCSSSDSNNSPCRVHLGIMRHKGAVRRRGFKQANLPPRYPVLKPSHELILQGVRGITAWANGNTQIFDDHLFSLGLGVPGHQRLHWTLRCQIQSLRWRRRQDFKKDPADAQASFKGECSEQFLFSSSIQPLIEIPCGHSNHAYTTGLELQSKSQRAPPLAQ